MLWTSFICCTLLCDDVTSAGGGGRSEKKKAPPDPNDNRGNTPFFLQDASDEMCLGDDHRVVSHIAFLHGNNLPVG